MIKNWQASAGALALNDDDLRKASRRATIVLYALLIFLAIIYIGTLILGGWELFVAWGSGRSEDWREFWDSAWMALRFSPFLLLARADVWRSVARTMQSVVAARQAAVAGDDARAPRVDPQLAPVSHSLTPDKPFGPLRLPLGTRINGWIVTLIVFILFGLITALVGGILLGTAQGDESEILGGLITLGVALLFLLLSALTIWRLVALTRPFFVRADDWGLRWRESGRRRRNSLTWHEAQAFIVLRNSTTGERPQRAAFALVGREISLVWRTTATDAESARLAHERLAGLIVGRTRLPLRDITQDVESAQTTNLSDPATVLAMRISARRKDAELAAHLALSQSPHASREVETTPARAPVYAAESGSPVKAKPARPLAGCLITLIGVLPSLALLGAGWGLQNYQPTYYSGLVSRVHAQQPLFADKLTYDDGQWPVEEDNEYHENYFFAYDGYHMKGLDPDRLMFAYGSPTYGDVAVEVTATQRGTAQYDGVGILARVTESQDDRVAFMVMPSGDWWIGRYHYTKDNSPEDWTTLDYGYSSAIHTGDGAQNQLLMILRGSVYYCFVNGRYLGSFHDYGSPLNAGHYGVYMNTSVVEGIFTDFAVYPAPSTDVFA